jgi:hypothetical protein
MKVEKKRKKNEKRWKRVLSTNEIDSISTKKKSALNMDCYETGGDISKFVFLLFITQTESLLNLVEGSSKKGSSQE